MCPELWYDKNFFIVHLIVEDQKELPSAVNPELRQKEVQMNFFNQLTSVFNPDLTTLSASPSAAHMQASYRLVLWHFLQLLLVSVFTDKKIPLYL